MPPLDLVVARSDHGFVALSHAFVYPTGVQLELVAAACALKGGGNVVFRDQHRPGGGEPSAAFLRLGLELADGTRVSTLPDRRRLYAVGERREPDAPVFVHAGGGGGQVDETSATIRSGYWLWPLPPAGSAEALLRVAGPRHSALVGRVRRDRPAPRGRRRFAVLA